jgi:hypothetical protein
MVMPEREMPGKSAAPGTADDDGVAQPEIGSVRIGAPVAFASHNAAAPMTSAMASGRSRKKVSKQTPGRRWGMAAGTTETGSAWRGDDRHRRWNGRGSTPGHP